MSLLSIHCHRLIVGDCSPAIGWVPLSGCKELVPLIWTSSYNIRAELCASSLVQALIREMYLKSSFKASNSFVADKQSVTSRNCSFLSNDHSTASNKCSHVADKQSTASSKCSVHSPLPACASKGFG
ncbi:hypothetical protein Acr_08g0010890 [Actinidia rufa]|uniref:Uncharacterized protein n=1 Tax=Actinidia rufa TaxID=165716 RepID=A0A7J0F259_9ERIC|nr:hypothetical protein Acr_08g0010890 [Actinidia rufa]